MGTHYFPSQNPQVLYHKAQEVANQIADSFPASGSARPALCYRGMSGAAWATALSIALWNNHGLKAGMIYVRKDAEARDCHGSRVEYELEVGSVEYVACFTDDFVSSGTTLREVAMNVQTFNSGMGEVSRVRWDERSLIVTFNTGCRLLGTSYGAEVLRDKREQPRLPGRQFDEPRNSYNRYTSNYQCIDYAATETRVIAAQMAAYDEADEAFRELLKGTNYLKPKTLRPPVAQADDHFKVPPMLVGMQKAAAKYGAPMPRARW